MESIWNKQIHPPVFPSLEEDLTAQAAVIGGGICGILTAFLLQRAGLKTIVLEADAIGSGQTHLTTAKITLQHGLIYHRLLTEKGFIGAKNYAESNRRGILAYENLIRELSISCFFEKLPAFLYTHTPEGMEKLNQEKNALLSLGIPCRICRKDSWTALCVDGQAQFHPLLFLYALAPQLSIYEHTKVTRVKGNCIYTEKNTVTANHIIFACHYPFVLVPGLYFLKMHQERSYAAALKGDAGLPAGMFFGIDSDTPSLRRFQDYTLIGGEGHRTGKNHSSFRYQSLKETAKKYFPEAVLAEAWSAQDCVTLDGLPYVGRFSPFAPNWYVATGFGKWGMSLSMAAALLLTDLICGRPCTYEELFSPKRNWNTRAIKSFLGEMKQASCSLSQSFLNRGQKIDADALLPGTGCIGRIDGKKRGIYKDTDDTLHLVSPRCPHLGCQLCWNPEDKTWDCPCHGSRFHRTGEIIDGPAQTGIHDQD